MAETDTHDWESESSEEEAELPAAMPDNDLGDKDGLPDLVSLTDETAEVLEKESESGYSPDEYDDGSLGGGATIRLTDFEKNIVHIAGHDMYVYNFKEQGIKLSPLTPLDAEKIDKVYIPSPQYSLALEKLENNRLLILSGRPHAGKYATALRLATEIASAHFGMSMSIFDQEDVIDIPVHILRFTDDASLVDFIEDTNCPSDRVFIIHDTFVVPGLGISELQRHLSYVCLLLEKMNGYAILTTDSDYIKTADFPETYQMELAGYDKALLLDILSSHLKYYSLSIDAKELPKVLRENIVTTLGTPYNIDRFAANLLREKALERSAIETVLLKTANIALDARLWFDDLKPNEQYYAMFIGLCPELDKEKLWELYDGVITALQVKKVKLDNAFNYPEGRLMLRTNSHLSDVNSLEFDNLVYRDYVLEQVRSSYSPQFKYLSSYIAGLVVGNKDAKDTRIALASALGEIGKSSWKNYVTIISKWAVSPDMSIRSAVAHSLRQVATSSSQRKEILALLKKWQGSPNYEYRWTVAASCERLYPFIPDPAIKLLEDLAGDHNGRVRSAVAHALMAIAKRDLNFILELILIWVKAPAFDKRSTSVNTFWRLMKSSNRLNMLLVEPAMKTKVFPILGESCVIGNNALTSAMDVLTKWIPQLKVEELPIIKDTLLQAFYSASDPVKANMLSIIESRWLTSGDSVLKDFAILLHYTLKGTVNNNLDDDYDDYDDKPASPKSPSTFGDIVANLIGSLAKGKIVSPTSPPSSGPAGSPPSAAAASEEEHKDTKPSKEGSILKGTALNSHRE